MTNNDDDLLNFFNLYELIEIKTGERIISAKEVFGDDVDLPIKKYIDGDGNEVVIYPTDLKIPIKRYAENDKDFELILKREADNKKQTPDNYKAELLNNLKLMYKKDVNEFWTGKPDYLERNNRVLKFIDYLENRKKQAKKLAKSFEDYIQPQKKVPGNSLKYKIENTNSNECIANLIHEAVTEGVIYLGTRDLKPFLKSVLGNEMTESTYGVILESYNLLKNN